MWVLVAVVELWSVVEDLVEWLTNQEKPAMQVCGKCSIIMYRYIHTFFLRSLGALGRPRLQPLERLEYACALLH